MHFAVVVSILAIGVSVFITIRLAFVQNRGLWINAINCETKQQQQKFEQQDSNNSSHSPSPSVYCKMKGNWSSQWMLLFGADFMFFFSLSSFSFLCCCSERHDCDYLIYLRLFDRTEINEQKSKQRHRPNLMLMRSTTTTTTTTALHIELEHWALASFNRKTVWIRIWIQFRFVCSFVCMWFARIHYRTVWRMDIYGRDVQVISTINQINVRLINVHRWHD